jgi:putative sigma-54 modulation protein
LDVTVSSRHNKVSEALRSTTIDKIGRLTRFLDGMDRADVHFYEERNPRITDKEVCEVTLEGHGHHVRCKVAAPDGFVAVDRAVEKLEHQLHKLKTKLTRRKVASRRGAGDGPAVAGDDADDDGDVAGPSIVKTKSFASKPMMPDEAVLMMDLLDHGFFLFTNAENDRAAVVYRRADGDFGLIEQS